MDKMLKNQATSATSEKDNDDDQSDKGTYTIELENPNSEEVEARKMIDKVNNWKSGMALVFVGCVWRWKLVVSQHEMLSRRQQCWNSRACQGTARLTYRSQQPFWLDSAYVLNIGEVLYIYTVGTC